MRFEVSLKPKKYVLSVVKSCLVNEVCTRAAPAPPPLLQLLGDKVEKHERELERLEALIGDRAGGSLTVGAFELALASRDAELQKLRDEKADKVRKK